MRMLNIQLQPDRAPELDIGVAMAVFHGIAECSERVKDFFLEEGEGDGKYINFTYRTDDHRHLWREIEIRVYSGEVSEAMRKSTIAICEGDDGWNDHLLLHHYDASVLRDEL